MLKPHEKRSAFYNTAKYVLVTGRSDGYHYYRVKIGMKNNLEYGLVW